MPSPIDDDGVSDVEAYFDAVYESDYDADESDYEDVDD